MRQVRVVAGAILRDGRVFAARRGPGQRQAGLWELPGGKVEPGESDAAALARELEEELGIQVEVGGHLDENLHQYPDLAVLLVALACRLPAGEPQPTEHDAVRWLGPDELDAVVWAPADVPLLDAVRAALRGESA